jgi:hypothetical protein
MIKTLLILVLLLALGIGAAATRPSEASFKEHVHQKMTSSADGFFDKVLLEMRVQDYLEQCHYHNRLLWADVEKDGQTVYTGVFNHWIARGSAKTEVEPKPPTSDAGPVAS